MWNIDAKEDSKLEVSLFSSIDPTRITNCSSILGDYKVQVYGILENPDVLQLSTPASIRVEHPIATMISWTMDSSPTYVTIKALANGLRLAVGAFCFCLVSKDEKRAIVALRNMNMLWDKEQGKFVHTDVTQNKVYLFAGVVDSTGEGQVDYVDTDIPCGPAGRRLYVAKTYDDACLAQYKPGVDFKITYQQMDYKFKNFGATNYELAELVISACKYAEEIHDDRLIAIVMGFDTSNCDLLAANTLMRLVYVMTNHKLILELPVYDSIIRCRVNQTG